MEKVGGGQSPLPDPFFDQGSEMRKTLEERFDEKYTVNEETGCWEWTGARSPEGYSRIGHQGNACYGHRIAHERYIGPIPAGLEVDHLCRVRHCVNPAHLEAVTHSVNVQRGVCGEVSAARNRAKKACPHGHPYEGDNLYVVPRTGYRVCLMCKREKNRLWMRRYRKAKTPRAALDAEGLEEARRKEREYTSANRERINRRRRARRAEQRAGN